MRCRCPWACARRSQRRLEPLPPPVHQLLTIASVIGAEFDLDTARRASPVPTTTSCSTCSTRRPAPASCTSSRTTCTRWRFEHALVRETLYDSLKPRERARLHKAIAENLEQRVDDRQRPRSRRRSPTTSSRRRRSATRRRRSSTPSRRAIGRCACSPTSTRRASTARRCARSSWAATIRRPALQAADLARRGADARRRSGGRPRHAATRGHARARARRRRAARTGRAAVHAVGALDGGRRRGARRDAPGGARLDHSERPPAARPTARAARRGAVLEGAARAPARARAGGDRLGAEARRPGDARVRARREPHRDVGSRERRSAASLGPRRS